MQTRETEKSIHLRVAVLSLLMFLAFGTDASFANPQSKALACPEASSSGATAKGLISVRIDAASNAGVATPLIGFVHGISAPSGPDYDFPPETAARIAALNPTLWKVSDTRHYLKARSFGAEIMYASSDEYFNYQSFYYPWNDTGTQSGQFDNWSGFNANAIEVLQRSLNLAYPVNYWGIINEPQFIHYSATDQGRLLDTFKHGYHSFKDGHPEQMVVAPTTIGYNHTIMENLLNYAVANNLRFDALDWHELGSRPEDVLANVQDTRALLAARPSLGTPTILIDEYASTEQHHLPGFAVAWFYYLELAGVDRAARACWNVKDSVNGVWANCWDGLNGLFMKDNRTPQALYWVFERYAQMLGRRLSSQSTAPTDVVALARSTSIQSGSDSEIRVLVGRFVNDHREPSAEPTSVEIAIENLPSSNQCVSIHAHRIPYLGPDVMIGDDPTAVPLTSPMVVESRSVAVVDGRVSILLPNFLDREAYYISITQAPQSPTLQVQAGYGSGEYAAGTALQIFSEAAGPQRLFERWLGDAPLLADARAWDARFTMPDRASSLTAQFTAVAPIATPVSDSINGARYLYSIPPDVRGLIFSFHGSGGSGDLPFARYSSNEATRRYLAHGFGIVGLDSVDRVNRQWNPAFTLTNPDVVNVQAIIDRLRAAGTLNASTPIFCEGNSNGGAFCSRVSALLRFRAQSLVIADGIGAVLAQSTVPTIWSLARNDGTLAPGYLERTDASHAGFSARGIASELNVLEPSPIYSERFARITGISLTDSGAITANLRAAGLLDPAGNLLQNPSPELLATLIPVELRSFASDIEAEINNAYAAHQYIANFAHRVVHFFEAQLAANYTGLWWKADEPGWGLSLAHQGSTLFPTWYTYQSDGKPVWFSGGALVRQSDGAYRGPAYRIIGQPFNLITGPVLTQATELGTFELRPRSDGALDFDYVIGAVNQSRRIERTLFGALPACRFVDGSRADGPNRSDIWWNPREGGWGLSLAEQDQILTLTWYTYAADGSPMWLIGTLLRDQDGRFGGALVRPLSGTAFSQISGPATVFPVPAVGSAEVEFSDGERAIFRYTLDGISQSKDIERFVFARPGLSDCQ